MTDQPAQPWDQPHGQQPSGPPQHGAPPVGAPAPGVGAPGYGPPAYGPPAGAAPRYAAPAYGPPPPGPSQPGPPPAPSQLGAPIPGQQAYGSAYGQGFAPPAPRKPAWLPAALPMSGSAYAQVFQPLERRVGRWFIAWAIAVGFFAAGQLLTIVLLLPGMLEFAASIDPLDPPTDPEEINAELLGELLGTPLGMVAVNLAWGSMIPGAIVAMAAFGSRAAGFASSVVGHWRWSAVGRAAIVVVPIFAVYIGLSLWLDPSMEWEWDPNWGLVAAVLLTTPLQATGEEFTFRGLLPQMMGGWRIHRYVPALVMLGPVALVILLQPATWWLSVLALAAAAVGPWVLRGRFGNAVWTGVATGLLFGAMHAHPSIAATLQLSLVGFTCSMLTYRTGGLEAASVLHTANNVFIMVPLALTGTSAFASAQPVAGEDWLSFGITAVALGLAYVAVHFTMRGAQRFTSGSAAADMLEPPAPSAAPAPMRQSAGYGG